MKFYQCEICGNIIELVDGEIIDTKEPERVVVYEEVVVNKVNSVKVFDLYKGSNLGENKKAIVDFNEAIKMLKTSFCKDFLMKTALIHQLSLQSPQNTGLYVYVNVIFFESEILLTIRQISIF